MPPTFIFPPNFQYQLSNCRMLELVPIAPSYTTALPFDHFTVKWLSMCFCSNQLYDLVLFFSSQMGLNVICDFVFVPRCVNSLTHLAKYVEEVKNIVF